MSLKLVFKSFLTLLMKRLVLYKLTKQFLRINTNYIYITIFQSDCDVRQTNDGMTVTARTEKKTVLLVMFHKRKSLIFVKVVI